MRRALLATLVLAALCLGASPAVGAPGTGAATPGGRRRVIVALDTPVGLEGQLGKEQVSQQRQRVSSAQQRLISALPRGEFDVVARYEVVPMLALAVSPAAEAALRSVPGAKVSEDALAPATLGASVPLVGADIAQQKGMNGKGVAIAVLDTGVDGLHPAIKGKVVDQACYSLNLCPNGATSMTGIGAGVPCTTPGCNHGTHVAGIAAGKSGVANGANLVAIQVFTRFTNAAICAGAGLPAPCVLTYTSDQLSALQYAFNRRTIDGIGVVNMSLGGGVNTTNCDTDARKAMVDQLRSVGVATVVAAGNSASSTGLAAPACISTTISVGGTTKADAVDQTYSNSASFLSLLAPGTNIVSSVPGGGTLAMSGTSMATPHVAGAIAILKQACPKLSVDKALMVLQNTGKQVLDPRNNLAKPRLRVDTALASVQLLAQKTGGC